MVWIHSGDENAWSPHVSGAVLIDKASSGSPTRENSGLGIPTETCWRDRLAHLSAGRRTSQGLRVDPIGRKTSQSWVR
jgi:hypothetical protein